MHFLNIADRHYAQFERLRTLPGLVHAFSMRPQDVSARTDGLAPQRAVRRGVMAADWGLDAARLHYCVQIHETGLRLVVDVAAGGAQENEDGLYTNAPGLPLMTFSADCPLVLVYDPRRRALGMCHASWRCTVATITRRLVDSMHDAFACDAADLQAGIGPSAGPCCYEVQEDVRAAAVSLGGGETLFPRRDGRMYFDLWQANRLQLLAAGLPDEQIEISGICTMCRNDLFYSFRRERAGCGHFGLMAAIA